MASSLAGRPVLVTGAAGFIGRHLLPRLRARGARVVALDERLPEEPAGEVTWLSGSVLMEADLVRALEALPAGKAVLFHLAGWSHVGQCEDDSEMARALNTDAPLRLAELWLARGQRRMVFPSTVLVYAAQGPERPLREDDPTRPDTVYAQTKLEAEQGLARLADQQGLCVQIARLTRVYGPGAAGDTVVALALNQARRGQAPKLKNPGRVLDLIHVDDVAEGLCRLAELPEAAGCQVVNLASGRGCRVAQLAAMVGELAGLAPAAPAPDSGGQGGSLMLDISRLRELTGWQPEYDLAVGLAQTWREMKGRRG
ncbi:MAG: NAD(P)-dependent oxidoreductase [Thermodesulfobacteriota bacterium]